MSAGQQFNLRWNNHTNNILQVFMEQFTGEHLVDCTLSCQGQFLKAHKMVLSACSPYFQELFRQHQVQHPVIIMNGMKFNDIKLVVEFMYRGEIKVLETELDGLLASAETLQVKGLSNVRNKYEKKDIKESDPSQGERNELVDSSDITSVSPSVPVQPKRKRRKCVHSPMTDFSDTGEVRNEEPLATALDTAVSNSSPEKETRPPEQDINTHYGNDDDFSPTIKVEPPDIRDIDEESAGWESPKLVIDLPDSHIDQNKPNSASPKQSPRISVPLSQDGSPEYGNQYMTEFSQNAPGTSQGNADLVQQIMESERENTQVSQWLKKRTGKIPRPPNAFMIFANEWRRKLAFQHPTESNKEISVRLGIMWKNLSSDTKEGYYSASRRADEEHKRKYPGYYYSPKEARLRKSMKHNLAMIRKGPKAVEAMHLVKVLMTDDNDSPPYIVQDPSTQIQHRDQQMLAQKKMSPRVVRPEALENDSPAHHSTQRGVVQPLERRAFPGRELGPGEQRSMEVGFAND